MTKYLSKILGINESEFMHRIARLEHASSQTGIDIRLESQIRTELRSKMAELGLDPSDTVAEELFHALRTVAMHCDHELQKKIGVKKNTSSVDILTASAKCLAGVVQKQKVWSIKRSAIKKLFNELPPHKTMKTLHYRSEASMLKREQAAELYAVAQLLEGAQYTAKMKQAFKKLKPSDFEEHALEVICFSEKRWNQIHSQLKKQTVPVFSIPEIAAIVVIPIETTKTQCLALLCCALILRETRRIKEHAAYLKLKTLDPHLHTHVQIIAVHGRIPIFTLHNEPVYWHHLHHILGRHKTLPEQFHPHIAKEDLLWLSIETQLASIEKSLLVWVGTHRLAFVSDKQVVSLHILDVALATMYNQDVSEAQNIFVKELVGDELIEAYLEVPPFNKMVSDQVYKLTDL